MPTKIRSKDLQPGDVVRFEYGDYDNWVTVRIDQVVIINETGRFRQRLDWHYLSEEQPPQPPQPASGSPQFTSTKHTTHTCYGDPNELIDLIERK